MAAGLGELGGSDGEGRGGLVGGWVIADGEKEEVDAEAGLGFGLDEAEFDEDLVEAREADAGADALELFARVVGDEVVIAAAAHDAAVGFGAFDVGFKDGTGVVVEAADDGEVEDDVFDLAGLEVAGKSLELGDAG